MYTPSHIASAPQRCSESGDMMVLWLSYPHRAQVPAPLPWLPRTRLRPSVDMPILRGKPLPLRFRPMPLLCASRRGVAFYTGPLVRVR